MKEVLSYVFTVVGVFFCFVVLCALVNPENITKVSITMWIITGFIVSGWLHS